MRRVLFCSALVLAAVTALTAQVAPKPDGKKLVILAGCLGGGPSQFVLTNVTMAPPESSGKEAAAPAPDLAPSYDLVSPTVSLAAHAGHRVQLTGLIGEAAGGGADDAKAPPKGAQDPVSKARAPRPPAPRFTVSALKMVSPICLQ